MAPLNMLFGQQHGRRECPAPRIPPSPIGLSAMASRCCAPISLGPIKICHEGLDQGPLKIPGSREGNILSGPWLKHHRIFFPWVPWGALWFQFSLKPFPDANHGAGIFANICPKNGPNVGKYSIHGASGIVIIIIIPMMGSINP